MYRNAPIHQMAVEQVRLRTKKNQTIPCNDTSVGPSCREECRQKSHFSVQHPPTVRSARHGSILQVASVRVVNLDCLRTDSVLTFYLASTLFLCPKISLSLPRHISLPSVMGDKDQAVSEAPQIPLDSGHDGTA